MNVGICLLDMPKGDYNKLSKESVIARFRAVHGDTYDYSFVEYINNKTPVKVICPTHGVFRIAPEHHANGVRCQKCAIEARKANKVYGIGINDSNSPTRTKSYRAWRGILGRCYSNKCLAKNPTYAGCSVCDKWLSYSNFEKWFDENYIEGYDLDKDLICKGNRVYAPDVCCFVPHRINSLIIGCNKARGAYPKGVSKIGNKYSAYLRRDGRAYRVGLYNTPIEAFQAYKTAKEAYIREVATTYYNEDKITERVYNALMNYQVEIND